MSLNFWKKNNILYKYQFGFRKNYSTVLAVIDVLEDIFEHLDRYIFRSKTLPGEKIKLFADDTNLFMFYKDSKLVCTKATDCLNK